MTSTSAETSAEAVVMKECTKCKEMKPKTIEFFYKSGKYDKHGNYHLLPYCKKCDDLKRKKNGSHNVSSNAWYTRNREKVLEKRRRDRLEKKEHIETPDTKE